MKHDIKTLLLRSFGTLRVAVFLTPLLYMFLFPVPLGKNLCSPRHFQVRVWYALLSFRRRALWPDQRSFQVADSSKFF